jgi:hypothetical protein
VLFLETTESAVSEKQRRRATTFAELLSGISWPIKGGEKEKNETGNGKLCNHSDLAVTPKRASCRVPNVSADVRPLKFLLYSRARARLSPSEDCGRNYIRKQFENWACVRASAGPRHRACRVMSGLSLRGRRPGEGRKCPPRGVLKLR